MKNIILMSTLVFGTCGMLGLGNVPAQAGDFNQVEVGLESLLAPSHGYDDNNNVEIVLHGSLPNTCYKLSDSKVEKNPLTHKIRVRQFARVTHEGPCAQAANLPPQMQMTVPFTQVVSLGTLKSGDYQFVFKKDDAALAGRLVNVKKALSLKGDDYPYASISSATTVDVVKKQDELKVTLSGVFTNSCAYLDNDSVKVEKINDVYVVLPVLKFKTGVMCLQALIPFAKDVDLGSDHQEGHMLVHVRSMNGVSVNQVVTVTD